MNLREKFRKKYFTPEIKDKINNDCIIFLQYHKKDDLQKYIQLLRTKLITKDIYRFIDVNADYKWTNINRFSRMFNEYCELYYVWKNIDKFKDKKIFGFGHYRRWPNIFSNNMNYYFDLIYNKDYIHGVDITYNNISKSYLNNRLSLYDKSFCDSKYKLILLHLGNWYFPKIFMDEMIEYLNSMSEKYPLLNTSFSGDDKYFFVRRSTFICNKKVFLEMMEFISGYFDKIMKSQNLSFGDYDGFIKWYYENIIKEFQKLMISGKPLNEIFEYDNYFKFLFMGKQEYQYMFDEESYYGLYKNCNAWRVFGYITELLVSIFCIIHDKILYTSKIHFIFGNGTCAYVNDDEFNIVHHAQLINHTNLDKFDKNLYV